MKKITDILHDFLIENNFEFYEDWEDGDGVYTNGIVMIRLINPNENNDDEYVVSFDLWNTFDRWSICLDEYGTKNVDEIVPKTTRIYKFIMAHVDDIEAHDGEYGEEPPEC